MREKLSHEKCPQSPSTSALNSLPPVGVIVTLMAQSCSCSRQNNEITPELRNFKFSHLKNENPKSAQQRVEPGAICSRLRDEGPRAFGISCCVWCKNGKLAKRSEKEKGANKTRVCPRCSRMVLGCTESEIPSPNLVVVWSRQWPRVRIDCIAVLLTSKVHKHTTYGIINKTQSHSNNLHYN